MTQGEDGPLGQESGMVDGAVVDDLDQGFVFIADCRVVDVG